MSEDRSHQAAARIEAALERIAAVAAQGNFAAAGDPALAARHERLRQATRAAVAELDALIGGR